MASELNARIRSAGYWRTSIRPLKFKKDRVGVFELMPLLKRCVVEVRGWDFPHIDPNRPEPVPHLDFVEQESDWQHMAERWRFYQSGLFTDIRVMPYDWRDRSAWWPPDDNWKRGAQLGMGDAIFTIFEVYEFAARLANTTAGDDQMQVTIEVGGLKDRVLVNDDPRRMFIRGPYIAQIDEPLPIRRTLSRQELLTTTQELSVTAARELFARFGRDLSDDLLRDWLNKLLKPT